MFSTIFKRKHKIVFLYAPRYQYSGSTVMRGEQLSSIINRYYKDHYRVSYEILSTNFRNSTIFLTKGAITDITLEQLAALRKQGNKILFDPVDNPLDVQKAMSAHGIIAASLEAFDSYKKSGFPSYLVNHHVDPRIARDSIEIKSGIRCAYFGELINTIKTDRISKYVSFFQVDTGKQTTDWLTEPPKYNLHYAVRSNNVEAFKPFLKGFTAATCRANIIIQKDQKEAVRWLGKDYPYLLKSNPAEKDILKMLQYAEETFGSKVWKQARNKMEKIRLAITDQAIADEFIKVVESVRQLG